MAIMDPHRAAGIEMPPRRARAITPDDDNDLPQVTRALWVSVKGDLPVILADDVDPVTLVGVTNGQVLPLQVRRILATGNTCGQIIAFF